jgi:tRNA/rRNA methyltransferase
MSILERTRVVLVHPREPLNVGSALRAAFNMGIRDLRIVAPSRWEVERATTTAPGLEDEVRAIPHHETLEEAVGDGVVVLGFTSRPRSARRQVWDLEQLCAELPTHLPPGNGRLCLVFGQEDRGLSNEALDRCNGYVCIATDPEHHSLNLAQAVLLGCYAARRADGVAARGTATSDWQSEHPPTTNEQLEGLIGQVQQTLDAVDFFKFEGAETSVMRSLRAVFSRSGLDERELQILRGVFAEILGRL